jgi:hypothetical protein
MPESRGFAQYQVKLITGDSFMEAILFKHIGYSLSKLIEDVDIGEIGLPDIHRPQTLDRSITNEKATSRTD